MGAETNRRRQMGANADNSPLAPWKRRSDLCGLGRGSERRAPARIAPAQHAIDDVRACEGAHSGREREENDGGRNGQRDLESRQRLIQHGNVLSVSVVVAGLGACLRGVIDGGIRHVMRVVMIALGMVVRVRGFGHADIALGAKMNVRTAELQGQQAQARDRSDGPGHATHGASIHTETCLVIVGEDREELFGCEWQQ